MGTHYTVYISDDHLGLLMTDYATAATSEDEAKNINEKLKLLGANIYCPFEYIPKADMIVGELRKCHPKNYAEVFSRYDNTYYRDDSRGSHLIPLKERN